MHGNSPVKIKALMILIINQLAAKGKTDAIDSYTLTELLMADLIPQAHLRKAENRIKQSQTQIMVIAKSSARQKGKDFSR